MNKTKNEKVVKHIKCYNDKMPRKMIFDFKEQHVNTESNVYYVFDIYKK